MDLGGFRKLNLQNLGLQPIEYRRADSRTVSSTKSGYFVEIVEGLPAPEFRHGNMPEVPYVTIARSLDKNHVPDWDDVEEISLNDIYYVILLERK